MYKRFSFVTFPECYLFETLNHLCRIFLRQNIACIQLFISGALLNLRESYRTIHSLDGNLEFYRIPGVLQRFGVCYLFVAMMQLLLRPTNNEDRKV